MPHLACAGVYKLGTAADAITVSHAYYSLRGRYPDDLEKANQDAFKLVGAFNGNPAQLLLGVFDGHGEHGHECSQFVRDQVEQQLMQSIALTPNEWPVALTHCFTTLNARMHKQARFPDNQSGTTAISCLLDGSTLWVANIGDSRAVLGKTMPNGSVRATAISDDQTPFRKDERERIRAAGGVVMSMSQLTGEVPMHENWGSEAGEEVDTDGDPPRVWLPGQETPGCAFTRSIGDAVGERVGVFAEPEVAKSELKQHDRLLILASDGVWEFLTNQVVVEMAMQHTDPFEACRHVVTEAYKLWLQFDVRSDDITMICAFLDHHDQGGPASRSQVPNTAPAFSRDSSPPAARGSAKSANRPVRHGMSQDKRRAISSFMDDAGEDDSELPSHAMSASALNRLVRSEREA